MNELKAYLTHEEKIMLEVLLTNAKERKRKKEGAFDGYQYLLLGCQYELYKGLMQESEKEADFESDIQQLMKELCNFCKKYQICYECHKNGERGEAKLPF